MLILTIRTDKPEAEITLYDNHKQLNNIAWEAHRQLAETIHLKIKELLASQRIGLNELQGLVAYQGPGSFTGLRIGLSVANALADSLQIPIVAGTGENWQNSSIEKLLSNQNEKIVLPEYGAAVKTTEQKK